MDFLKLYFVRFGFDGKDRFPSLLCRGRSFSNIGVCCKTFCVQLGCVQVVVGWLDALPSPGTQTNNFHKGFSAVKRFGNVCMSVSNRRKIKDLQGMDARHTY